jgi:hypothetical protein
MRFEKSAPCFSSPTPSVTLDFSGPSVKPHTAPSAKSTFSYGGSTPAYSYGGNTYNSSGYLANPSRLFLKTIVFKNQEIKNSLSF